MRDIKDYEGRYVVTEDGRIFNIRSGRELRQTFVSSGYKRVCLYNKNIKKDFLVHRLVCAAYHGESKLEVNHIDCNKLNNHASNLEWCSRKENIKHAVDNGRFEGHANRLSQISRNIHAVSVVCIDLHGNIHKTYSALSDAQKDGFFPSKISLCINGKAKLHRGYIWKLANEINGKTDLALKAVYEVLGCKSCRKTLIASPISKYCSECQRERNKEYARKWQRERYHLIKNNELALLENV